MRVRLKLKANKLSNVAGLFKGTSDPYARVFLLGDARISKVRTDRGSTEVIKNNLSPDWTTTFNFDYKLGTRQVLEICIYDEIRKSEDKLMGCVQFEIGEILGSKGNVKVKDLPPGGVVIARLEEVQGSGSLRLQVSGDQVIMKRSFMGRKPMEYFYQISRNHLGHQGTEWCIMHRSEQLSGDLNLQWDETIIDLSVLCGNDLNVPILFEVLNYKRNGRHVLIGRSETTVPGIIAAARNASGFTLSLDEKESGQISFQTVELLDIDDDTESILSTSHDETPIEVLGLSTRGVGDDAETISKTTYDKAPTEKACPSVINAQDGVDPSTSSNKETFFQYMKGGCELSVKIAIDFTGSNGDPRELESLHFLNTDGSQNDYEKAISAISEILLDYVPTKKLAVWGFGAKYGGQLFNCFQCGPNAESDGVIGALESYRLTFKSGLVMSGPTDITGVIRTAAGFATSEEAEGKRESKQVYTTLLILTDGSVADIKATCECLQQFCDTALSIIIVGIGNADFSRMKFLDDHGSKYDICQFVEFNSYKDDLGRLTRASLEEIPDHLVSYFTRHGIKPNPPINIPDEDFQSDSF